MRKFLQNLNVVLAALGLAEKMKNHQLSAEEQNSIIDAYNKQFGENAFATDHAQFEDDQKKAAEAAAMKNTFEQLAGILGTSAEAPAATAGTELVEAVKGLQSTIKELGSRSQGNEPAATVERTVTIAGAHTDKFAFGVMHSMFSASKRWNRIAITRNIAGDASEADKRAFNEEFTAFCESVSARVNELTASGMLRTLKPQSAVTVSGLNNDTEIGTRQFTVRQDALIARIVALPSLDGVFAKVSNVQSGQIITNVLFSKISQAYQSGHVYKGSVDILPEKAKLDKAMAKVLFSDMSALETSYLNYLNTSGSDPVKWNMIEWFLLHIATEISNEKNERAILGRYIAPTANVAGHHLYASTGMIHRLISYVDDLKLNPFEGNDVDDYSSSTIGDTLIAFVARIAAVRKDWKNFVIYVNEAHKPWFIHWYQSKYGQFNNYAGDVTTVVPEYGNKIVWVPNMGQLQFIFSSLENNLQLLENVPGEEYRTQFQRDLESIIAFSYWKEGTAAGFVGPKYASASAMKAANYADQVVFMNWPAAAVAADATALDAADAVAGNIFQLPNTNTDDKAITNISNAVEGVVYRIVAPATAGTYKTTIAKSGNFAGLTKGVDFSDDKFVDVVYNGTTFTEVARG